MDGWTDGLTHERTGGRTYKLTDRQIYIYIDIF